MATKGKRNPSAPSFASSVGGQLYPFPINLTTLEQFFHTQLTEKSGKELLDSLRLDIPESKNSEEFVLSRVGKKLYKAFYLDYTLTEIQFLLIHCIVEYSMCLRTSVD
ncbi:MAG: hypothetical protein ABIQ95_01125 [Bdellovibrionia bacterium]